MYDTQGHTWDVLLQAESDSCFGITLEDGKGVFHLFANEPVNVTTIDQAKVLTYHNLLGSLVIISFQGTDLVDIKVKDNGETLHHWSAQPSKKMFG